MNYFLIFDQPFSTLNHFVHIQYMIQYYKAYCENLLFCRPLCASGMDKLELQDCLEHGRLAKVSFHF